MVEISYNTKANGGKLGNAHPINILIITCCWDLKRRRQPLHLSEHVQGYQHINPACT